MALTSVTTSLLDIANSDPVEDIFQQVVGTTGKPQTRDVRPQHSTGGGGVLEITIHQTLVVSCFRT